MILVILAVCIALLLIGLVLAVSDCELSGGISAFAGVIGVIVCICAICFFIGGINDCSVADERIAMYEEENAEIEADIENAVTQYQQYETGVFTQLAPNSTVTLVALYPELKSDALVQKQLEVYIANNEKIKELKETKIYGRVYKWWLYFGGAE